MAETAIVKQTPQAVEPGEFSREKIELIKRTVAKGVTDDELQLFLYTAQRCGLDPLAKQIHAVSRFSKKENRSVMSIQTGIDGYRLIADRTGKLAGIDDVIFDSEEGSHPNKASVTVHKIVDGSSSPFTASARWSEYCQTDREGNPTSMWIKMPYLMLGKCAEALALRKAFPADLSGVYTFEEMQQADNEPRQQSQPNIQPRQQGQTPLQQNTQRKAPPKAEVVVCAQCLSASGHTSDCPTRNKPDQDTAKDAPKVIRVTMQVLQMEIKTSKDRVVKGKTIKGRTFVVLSCKRDDKVYDLYSFHDTANKHAASWIGKSCNFEVSEKPSSDNTTTFLNLEKICKAGDVDYKDNEPVVTEEYITDADEADAAGDANPFDQQ